MENKPTVAEITRTIPQDAVLSYLQSCLRDLKVRVNDTQRELQDILSEGDTDVD